MSRKSNGRTPAAAKRASGAGAKSQAEQTPVSAQRPSSADVVAQSENARSAPTSGSSEANGTGGSASSPAAATEVRVSAAKGRPMLAWVGKRPLSHVKSFPAQLVESFGSVSTTGVGEWWSDWPTQYPPGGLLFHGDNKEVLGHLLANGLRGKVNLIYIDPPFDSGADYVRKVSLRGAKGAAKLEGEAYTLGEQIQYTDIWANDNYLQFMYERLQLLAELLAPNGAFYLHCDPRKSHHLRALLDEVFGPDAFVSEIIWQSSDAQSSANRYGPIHNTIFYYARQGRTWNSVRTPLSRATADNWYTHEETLEDDTVNKLGILLPRGTVRRYNMGDLTARKRGGDTEGEWRGIRPPAGRYWAYSKANLDSFYDQGRIAFSSSGRPYLKRYLDEVEGTPPQDLWTDIPMLRGISSEEATGYPTEKPERLLERIIRVSSNPGDLVLDCFIGSGTTAAVAQKLGRRWIACDINKGAIQTTAKRLQSIIAGQADNDDGLGLDAGQLSPAQLSFTTWRVNDYDLQVQHNEAVNLAAEFLGVQRTRTDSYFDGTLGTSVAKVIPFGRPLTPLDLEELRRELDARPDEDRPVTIVCLGMELAAQAWVDEWNAMRRGADAVNKIRVVELRTDPKYGGFLKHEPAKARVRVRRRGDRIQVEVVDFVSPSIVHRLQQQAGVLTPRIEDWRAMVDCVMIDPAFDGKVFNVALTDVPERKSDFVEGRYELPAPEAPTTVAVKIIDMLGEEVVDTCEV